MYLLLKMLLGFIARIFWSIFLSQMLHGFTNLNTV